MACKKEHGECDGCQKKIINDPLFEDESCGCDVNWSQSCEQCRKAFCEECATSHLVDKLCYVGGGGLWATPKELVDFSTCESCFSKLIQGIETPKCGLKLFVALDDL